MSEKIQEKLEKIDNNVRWLSDRMDRYFHALGEIASCGDQANAVYLRGVAQSALDGEPTTADEFNKDNISTSLPVQKVKWVSPHDPGDENDTMLEDEKLVHEREHVCKHNVPRNVECPMCSTSENNCKHGVGRSEVCTICEDSENKYHDTNAQIIAYDKSMEEE